MEVLGMNKENLEEFEHSNLINWHLAGYTGKNIKVASPENLSKGHGKMTVDTILQSAPDIELIDFDYTKWSSSGFEKFIDDCIEKDVDIIFNALMFRIDNRKYKALEKAKEAGIIFVTAIGNNNKLLQEDNKTIYTADNVFQVGAITLNAKNNITRMSYSNKGKVLDYAEFTNIFDHEGDRNTGTSTATPFFAGKLACMLQFYYEYGMVDCDIKFMDFVDDHLIDLGEEGRDDLFGKGFLRLPDLEEVLGMKATRDLNELEPYVKTLAEKLLQECRTNNIDIVITETYRSQERQLELYAQGRTTDGPVVTWTKNSKHKTRKAFDFVPLTNGKADWYDLSKFDKVGAIGKALGLTWGGDWKKTPDRPHFQFDGEVPLSANEIDCVTKKEFVTDINVAHKKHWAEQYFTELNSKGLIIHEKRFDDKMTRGEVFKMIALAIRKTL
jgi:hypothetical protein